MCLDIRLSQLDHRPDRLPHLLTDSQGLIIQGPDILVDLLIQLIISIVLQKQLIAPPILLRIPLDTLLLLGLSLVISLVLTNQPLLPTLLPLLALLILGLPPIPKGNIPSQHNKCNHCSRHDHPVILCVDAIGEALEDAEEIDEVDQETLLQLQRDGTTKGIVDVEVAFLEEVEDD